MSGTTLTLNLLLRGASVGMLVLIAAALWRDHPRALAARLGSAFALSVAAATLASMPGFPETPDFWHVPIAALSAGSMFLFWLFTCALFDDAFALRAWHALLWAALAALGVLGCLVQAPAHSPWAPATGLLLGILPVAWAVLAIAQSLSNWREDLIEGRRALRTLIVAGTALYTVAQLLAALLSGLTLKAVVESPANAAGVALLTLFVAWRLLRAGQGDLFGAAISGAEAGTGRRADPIAGRSDPLREADAGSGPDPRQVAALEALMTVERVYREPGLTIGALADRMVLPEHKLRRLINQGLGHRNFSAFLNAYRLAEARRWLSDPEQVDTPILTIAMDAGFQSLGPFNRAFKAETGVTPSEFRRLGGMPAAESCAKLAESGIG
ncbi:MAG TPA: AraC family transcriptional regulator [Variovorax sp.]